MVRLILVSLLGGTLYLLWVNLPASRCDIGVYSGVDGGAGSMRSAFAEAGRCPGMAVITFHVDRVYLKSTLPLIENPRGIKLIGAKAKEDEKVKAEAKSTEGTRIFSWTDEDVPILSLKSSFLVVSGLHLEGAHHATEAGFRKSKLGLLADAESVRITDSSFNRFELGLATSFLKGKVAVSGSQFDANYVGYAAAQDDSFIEIENSRFSNSGGEAISVRAGARSLVVRDVNFEGNHSDVVGLTQRGVFSGIESRGSFVGSLYLRSPSLALVDSNFDTHGDHAVLVIGSGKVDIAQCNLTANDVGVHALGTNNLSFRGSVFRAKITGVLHRASAKVKARDNRYYGRGQLRSSAAAT